MSLDRAHRTTSVVVCALVAVVAIGVLTARSHVGAGVLVLVVGVLVGSWALAPRAIVVEAGELSIERRAWRPLRVPLATIEHADMIQRAGGRTLRLFGVGGFFGTYGLFWSDALGRHRMYATRAGGGVIVRRRAGLPIVLTPDDAPGALAALQP